MMRLLLFKTFSDIFGWCDDECQFLGEWIKPSQIVWQILDCNDEIIGSA